MPLIRCVLAAAPFVPLGKGVEWRSGELQVVRISEGAQLELGFGERRTAAEWSRATHATAVINAGMFEKDRHTASGHLECGGHVNQRAWAREFQSALLFRPNAPGVPPFTLVDLDQSGARETLAKYDCVVQNLRLIKAPGQSVWRAEPRRWAEAALALDRQGRLLFVFSAKPVTMPAFIDALLNSDLDVVRAMHLDGGKEASLSLRAGTLALDLVAEDGPVALPNVLLVR